MRLIHSQCGGAVVVDRGVGPEVIKVSTRPGATGTDLLYAVRCSVCKETLGTVPNVETEYWHSNPASCMSRARDDEMTFVLLGRDVAAPTAIRAWAAERVRLKKNSKDDEQIQEALACALEMEEKREM